MGVESKVEIKLKRTKEGEKKKGGDAKVGVITTKYAKERKKANVDV